MQSSLTECEVAQLRASASKACALLKALANEDRLLILCQLTQGERNVGELEKMTGVRQPTLSQQLGSCAMKDWSRPVVKASTFFTVSPVTR